MQSLYDDRNFPATLSPPHDMEHPPCRNIRIAIERPPAPAPGASGTPELAQSPRSPRRSSSTASAAANRPVRPTANWSTSFPSSGPKGASRSRAPRTAAATNPLVSVHEATPRRCWTLMGGCAIHTRLQAGQGWYHHRPADQLPARADRQGRPGARRRPGGAPRPPRRRSPRAGCTMSTTVSTPSARPPPGPAHGRMNAASPGKAARR